MPFTRSISPMFLLAALLLPSAWSAAASPSRSEAPPAPEPAEESPIADPADVGRPMLGDSTVRHLIVTDRSLGAAFRRLARAHREAGLTSRVRTLQSIREAYPAGRDDAERVRLFLKDAYARWHTRFVLLGGDDPLIPMRRAYLDQMPFLAADSVILLPTDQYYACLDGDWNADGDDRWSELPNPSTGDAGDDADLIPELCVGRAPVTDRDQARVFVEKTIREMARRSQAGPLDVLLGAGLFDLIPGPSIFSAQAEGIKAQLEGAIPSRFSRLYGDAQNWPGALPLTPRALLDALERGPDLTILSGFGGRGVFATGNGTLSRDNVTATDLLELDSHDRPGHVVVLSAFTNAPGILSVGAALLRARHGGAVSVLGPTHIQFIAVTSAYEQGFFQQAYVEHSPTIGEAMRDNLAQLNLSWTGNLYRLTTLGDLLLGDPALAVPRGGVSGRSGRVSTEVGSGPLVISTGSDSRGTLAVGPNPAASAARIEYAVPPGAEGRPFELAVLDVAGRIVRKMDAGAAHGGLRSVQWDLRNDAGVKVPRGLYFVRASFGDRALVTRLVVR